MKNSTTAFILTIMCMAGNILRDSALMSLASAIFAATYLILSQLEEDSNKKD